MSDNLNLASAPHDLSVNVTGKLMRIVVATLIPAILVNFWYYGFGIIINLVLCLFFCLGSEGIILKLRKRHLNLLWRDSSAIVTAVILAIALPPLLPWYLTLAGCIFAIVIVKQIFGGLGQNIFNPAMAGFVFLLISCPLPMTTYIHAVPANFLSVNLSSSIHVVFGLHKTEYMQKIERDTLGNINQSAHTGQYAFIKDGFTGPTFLINAKHMQPDKNQPDASVINYIYDEKSQGKIWDQQAKILQTIAFFIGGLILLFTKIIDFRIPLAFLVTAGIFALICWLADPNSYLPPWMHLIYGATLFGAFYILTDPVTSVPNPRGAWIFGILTGLLFMIIRNFGGYPDAVAFCVLLGNAAAPLISVLAGHRNFGNGFSKEMLHEGRK